MKHLLDIKDFLLEALTSGHKETYHYHFNQRTQEVQDRLTSWLGEDERVYVPFQTESKSPTQKKVEEYLNTLGYLVSDYKLNQAVQIENNKRVIRISKLLAKDPELLKEFTLDDSRANARDVKTEYSIVFTSNFEDVAEMSTNRDWDSCMRLPYEDDEDDEGGCNYGYLQNDIEEGTIIAYFIRSYDKDIEEPLGRIAIKPYYNQQEPEHTLYLPDIKIYGNIPSTRKDFLKVINDWLSQRQTKKPGWYLKNDELYSDNGSPSYYLIKKDLTMCYDCQFDEDGYNMHGYDQEGYDRDGYNRRAQHRDGLGLLTQEQHDFLDKVTMKYNTINLVKKDGEVFVNVDGLVYICPTNFQGSELPVKFGKTQTFYISGMNIKTLVGVPNEVNGRFAVEQTSIVDLEGFPTLLHSFDIKHNPLLKTTKGFKPCDCSNMCILNNNGLEEIVDFGKSKFLTLELMDNKLTSLNGLEDIIVHNLRCQNNLISDLSDCPKSVGRLILINNNISNLDSLKTFVNNVSLWPQKTGVVFRTGDSNVTGYSFIGKTI
jgi:hypothetical protein